MKHLRYMRSKKMNMWQNSEIVNFKVAYDGSANSENVIDARILADSLIGISTAIEETNKLINGNQSEVFIKVKSGFNPGSFEVDLVQFLTSQGIEAASNIVSILGFVGGVSTYGLIQVLKKTKGGTIIQKQNVDNSNSEVYFENCKEPIVIQKQVIQAGT